MPENRAITTRDTLAKCARMGKPRKEFLRTFVERYEKLFGPLRDIPVTVLEVGVGGYRHDKRGGGGLRMLAAFFGSEATIVGLDLHPKSFDDMPENVNIWQGSQTDEDLLARMAAQYGGFDIVIDDASHITASTVATFEALWPHTRMMYIVEDLHMRTAKGTGDYFRNVIGVDFDTQNMCVVSRTITNNR